MFSVFVSTNAASTVLNLSTVANSIDKINISEDVKTMICICVILFCALHLLSLVLKLCIYLYRYFNSKQD